MSEYRKQKLEDFLNRFAETISQPKRRPLIVRESRPFADFENRDQENSAPL